MTTREKKLILRLKSALKKHRMNHSARLADPEYLGGFEAACQIVDDGLGSKILKELWPT
jgi:hypothetical protein